MTDTIRAPHETQAATIRHRVKIAVVEGLRLEMAPEDLDDDESLFGGLGADSTAALEIVVAIEEEFGFEVEDEDLTEELLASVGSLTAYVERAIGGGQVDLDERHGTINHAGVDDAEPAVAVSGPATISSVDDVPVILKSCPNCGRLPKMTDAVVPVAGGRCLDATERLGLEEACCPACGTWMTGRQPR